MLYVVRHGQTQLNSSHALQGRSDLPLNHTGIVQARAVGTAFAQAGIVFEQVYSSPLGRALQTAELMAPGIPVQTDNRLIEMDYGPYEGMDLSAPAPEVLEFFRDFVNNPAPEGMEQLADVVRRTGAFVEELRNASGNVLVSTHAIAMKGILEYLTPASGGGYWSKNIRNCEVYAAQLRDGEIGIPRPWKSPNVTMPQTL